MAKVTVFVTLKPSLLDAQGRTVEGAIRSMGHANVSNVRIGKIIEIEMTGASSEAAHTQATMLCDKLLANPVTESYRIEVAE